MDKFTPNKLYRIDLDKSYKMLLCTLFFTRHINIVQHLKRWSKVIQKMFVESTPRTNLAKAILA
jgi:hypothetical protein